MYLQHSVIGPLLRFIAFLLMYFTLINLTYMTTITILLPVHMVCYLSYLLAHLQRIPL